MLLARFSSCSACLQELEPRHPRHIEVEHDQRRLRNFVTTVLSAEHIQSLPTIAGDEDRIDDSLLLQSTLDGPHVDFIVVDDHDADRLAEHGFNPPRNLILRYPGAT